MGKFGKFLEFLGMVLLPLGLLYGLLEENIRLEVTLLAVGAGVFLLGRYLENRTGR